MQPLLVLRVLPTYLLVVVSANKNGALATADKTGVLAFAFYLNE